LGTGNREKLQFAWGAIRKTVGGVDRARGHHLQKGGNSAIPGNRGGGQKKNSAKGICQYREKTPRVAV